MEQNQQSTNGTLVCFSCMLAGVIAGFLIHKYFFKDGKLSIPFIEKDDPNDLGKVSVS